MIDKKTLTITLKITSVNAQKYILLEYYRLVYLLEKNPY